jgi:CRISPR-associated exonuclease Cas4
MTGRPVPAGAIFHAASKRRREVVFTPELRALTEDAVRKVRDMLASGAVPRPEPSPRCEGCSLKPMCLPEVAGNPAKVARHNAALYEASP